MCGAAVGAGRSHAGDGPWRCVGRGHKGEVTLSTGSSRPPSRCQAQPGLRSAVLPKRPAVMPSWWGKKQVLLACDRPMLTTAHQPTLTTIALWSPSRHTGDTKPQLLPQHPAYCLPIAWCERQSYHVSKLC